MKITKTQLISSGWYGKSEAGRETDRRINLEIEVEKGEEKDLGAKREKREGGVGREGGAKKGVGAEREEGAKRGSFFDLFRSILQFCSCTFFFFLCGN